MFFFLFLATERMKKQILKYGLRNMSGVDIKVENNLIVPLNLSYYKSNI